MVRSCIHFWHGAKEEAIVYNYLVLCQIFSRLYGRDLNHTEEGGEKRIWGGDYDEASDGARTGHLELLELARNKRKKN